MNDPFHLIQLSDLHLFATDEGRLLGLPTAQSLAAVLAAIRNRFPADALLLTGDLAQEPVAATYERLATAFGDFTCPVYWIPGNHDEPRVMLPALEHPPLRGDRQIPLGAWQGILLNSQVDGKVHGEFSTETLNWLDEQLGAASDRPTLIALHHPPFETGAPWLDSSRLQNPEQFFAVLDRHPQVKLVLFGHIHQEFATERQGVTYLGCPSTCIQFLPLAPEFSLEPIGPGFRQLWLHPDGTFRTQIERVEIPLTLDFSAKGY
ncbi:3',5'-cyclic-AMP phosphodiesterase [Thermosynechococcus sp. HN-54]|uniref:3',5'-cyclic-AMP phosphodiesterase n=1 Tax=Thermosynechococcus sp. HN-54 TaxID=2933959 RepID=UPI00202CE223|nr:3',5'-cyclic-AMP phosphodiesterase [Thermosynechococcus sp. HN-54]URR35263.1 3',5'-cyclic-AMP phosphodiesterase [Thermosynechococcus sp. HN-54]